MKTQMKYIKSYTNSLGATINYVEEQGRGWGRPNVNDTTKAYLVNLSTKGKGGIKNH